MSDTDPRKILICDDEEGVRESLKLVLGDHYNLILTDSGEQCLECLDKDKSIGLILLAVKITEIRNLKTLQTIQEKYPDLNVIILTNHKSMEAASETSPLDASKCIIKPFKADQALNIIQKNIK